MVGQTKIKGKTYFECEECKLAYKELSWAEECEAHCKEFNACNLEITKHAINK